MPYCPLRKAWLALVSLALIVIQASLVSAQPLEVPASNAPSQAPAAEAPAEQPPEDLRTKRQDVAERIVDAERSLESAKAGLAGEQNPKEPLSREVELLKQLDMLYAQLQSAEGLRKETEATQLEWEAKLARLRLQGPEEQRPYSFLLVENLRDNLSTTMSRAGTIEASTLAAADSLGRAKATLNQWEVKRRHAKESAGGAGELTTEVANELRIAELEVNVAKQTVGLRQAELANAKAAKQGHTIHLTILQETLEFMERDLVFSENDLHSVLVNIEKQEVELKQELQAAELSLDYFDRQWTNTRQKLDATAQHTAAEREEEQASKLARDSQLRRTTLMQKQLERLGPLRQAWRRRFQVAAGNVDRTEMMSWKTECVKHMDQLDLERQLEEMQVSETRRELADLEKRLQQAKDQDAELSRWIEREIEVYRQLVETHGTNLVRLEVYNKLHARLLNEINGKTQQHSPAELLAACYHGVVAIWNYELTNFDDQSVTVGKVITGFLLLFGGILLSRRLTKILARRILPKVGIHDGAAVAVQSLAFYVLVVTTALMALHMVNVPLTVFTFMGGAVAIGVGFGSQNILNNFISGVILLIERPIRVGDMIEVGDLYGTVERIGTRSTRIRTGTNLEIIIPNSAFLEGNVVNWTLSDTTIRCNVKIGIAYGSPTRDAARWLKRAADEHGLVLRKPEPFVWFAEFGESSLNFELHFWIGMRTLVDRRRIESDLRFIIDQYFREAGIIIAYPQRQLHLDTSTPLEVRMLPQVEASSTAEVVSKKAA